MKKKTRFAGKQLMVPLIKDWCFLLKQISVQIAINQEKKYIKISGQETGFFSTFNVQVKKKQYKIFNIIFNQQSWLLSLHFVRQADL